MSATALALIIAAALLHSIWNIAAKKAGGDDRFALIACAPLVTLWAPAREVSMLFAALLGARLLGEGDRGARIAGAVRIALGVAALALG